MREDLIRAQTELGGLREDLARGRGELDQAQAAAAAALADRERLRSELAEARAEAKSTLVNLNEETRTVLATMSKNVAALVDRLAPRPNGKKADRPAPRG